MGDLTVHSKQWPKVPRNLLLQMFRCVCAIRFEIDDRQADFVKSNPNLVGSTKDTRLVVISGFFAQFGNRPYIITAGHILQDISKCLRSGSTFGRARIVDGWHSKVPSAAKAEVPFVNFSSSLAVARFIDNDQLGIDLGAIPVHPHELRLIEKSGSAFLQNELVATPGEQFEAFVLVGFPKQLHRDREHQEIQADDGVVRTWSTRTIGFVPLPLEPIEQPDDSDARGERARWFKVADHSIDDSGVPLTDVDGMSGGPIFGFRREAEKWVCKLVGVQSCQRGEWPKSVMACLPGDFLRCVHESLQASFKDALSRETP